jgi:hypothetical protein
MNLKPIITVLISTTLLISCKVQYSLGNIGSIPEDANTFYVENFSSSAPQASPLTSQIISENLKTLILSQSRLNTSDNSSDLTFRGNITSYKVQNAGVQSNDQAAQNKLTISIKVSYKNKNNESDNFEKTFSASELFDANASLLDIENELIIAISEQINQMIFDEAFGEW